MHPSWAKTMIQNFAAGPPDPPVVVNVALEKSVEKFVYLDSLQPINIGQAADIMRRIVIVSGNMRKLDNIWLSRKIKTATKYHPHKTPGPVGPR